jgi:hypothetical protein
MSAEKCPRAASMLDVTASGSMRLSLTMTMTQVLAVKGLKKAVNMEFCTIIPWNLAFTFRHDSLNCFCWTRGGGGEVGCCYYGIRLKGTAVNQSK